MADTYFDYHNQFNDIEILEKAIDCYEKAKKYCPDNCSLLDLSLLNVQYELAICLKETNETKKSLSHLKNIELYLDKNFNTNSINSKNYELVFYKLALLEEKYKTSQSISVREEAIQTIRSFARSSFIKTDKSAKKLDVIGWLKSFALVFNIPISTLFPELNGIYSMASEEETNYVQKRCDQIKKGLTELQTNCQMTYGINLREHQKEAYHSILDDISIHGLNGGYLTLPTGAGKTIVMLLKTFAVRMPTLIVVPTTLLMDQTIEKIKEISPGTQVSRFDGNAKDRFAGQIMVTTYQSLEQDFNNHRRLSLKEFGLVWADEAHSALTESRSKIIQEMKKSSLVLGLTATDQYNTKRAKGAFSKVSDIFGNQLFKTDLITLINNQSLSGVKIVRVKVPAAQHRFKVKPKQKAENDYSKEELELILNQKKNIDIVQDIYLNEHDPDTGEPLFGKPALVFCSSIMHAETVTASLNENISNIKGEGTWAACIHSKMSKKTIREIIQKHKDGLIHILAGDKKFIEGYDNPMDTVAFNLRPTRSLVMATQRGGRLLRYHQDKEHAIIIEVEYPEFGDQIFFDEMLDGNRRIGVSEPEEENCVEPRKTANYQVEWPSMRPQINMEEPHFEEFQSHQDSNNFESNQTFNNYGTINFNQKINVNTQTSNIKNNTIVINNYMFPSPGDSYSTYNPFQDYIFNNNHYNYCPQTYNNYGMQTAQYNNYGPQTHNNDMQKTQCMEPCESTIFNSADDSEGEYDNWFDKIT
ncbi:MAG: DEAD/DEAH box helicase family protein [Candidatus Protochlamydia sp.]|nr:DEAD/DEAH box helicase family protein [Candidatus Protochlamydia sp.]